MYRLCFKKALEKTKLFSTPIPPTAKDRGLPGRGIVINNKKIFLLRQSVPEILKDELDGFGAICIDRDLSKIQTSSPESP